MIRLNTEKIQDIKQSIIFIYAKVILNPYLRVFILSLCIAWCIHYLYTFEYLKVEIPEFSYIKQKNLYIIDSGHGFNEKNKCKWKSVKTEEGCFYEYEFNNSVVGHLCALLDNAGIFYMRTDTLSLKRDMSITKRMKYVNNIHDKMKKAGIDGKVILFSIHANAAKNKDAKGFEVFTSLEKCKTDDNPEECEKNMHQIATLLSDNLKFSFPDKEFRNTSKAEYKLTSMASEGEITLLDRSSCYAVLSENGFYTNSDERKEMRTEPYIMKVAMAHYKTICALEGITP